MTDQEREENWRAVRTETMETVGGAARRVLTATWRYPEGELILVGDGLDLLRGKLGQLLADAQVEIRVRLDETGRIPGSPR